MDVWEHKRSGASGGETGNWSRNISKEGQNYTELWKYWKELKSDANMGGEQ